MTPEEALAQALDVLPGWGDSDAAWQTSMAAAAIANMPPGWSLTYESADYATIIEDTFADGGRYERERLRAQHQSWPGHPSLVSSEWCDICQSLLAEPAEGRRR